MTILYSCVVDSDPIIAYQATVWAWSLIHLAGKTPSDLLVHLTEECSATLEATFAQMGIPTRRVQTLSKKHPHSNKLLQLDSELLGSADYVVLCDCDLAFCRAIDDLASGSALCGKPADCANLSKELWQSVLSAAGLPPATEWVSATTEAKDTIPEYLNGGLLIIPKALWATLRLNWPKWNTWLLERPQLLKGFTFFTDQVSLALAMREQGIPYHHLSNEFNCPTHLDIPLQAMPEHPPAVLHYHRKLDSGGMLLRTGKPIIDKSIADVNEMLRARRRHEFSNEIFWQFRYLFDPEIGSGVGSRGENLRYKRTLVNQEVRRMAAKSVLDVGCGDLQVSMGLSVKRYTGIDISEAAIATAKSRRPDWAFACGDVSDMDLEPHDVVLCFDVLIHQPTREAYDCMCSTLMNLTRDYLIIGAYNQMPWHTSEITFYYEPITETLRRDGQGTLTIIGGYRDTTIVVWSRDGKPWRAEPKAPFVKRLRHWLRRKLRS